MHEHGVALLVVLGASIVAIAIGLLIELGLLKFDWNFIF